MMAVSGMAVRGDAGEVSGEGRVGNHGEKLWGGDVVLLPALGGKGGWVQPIELWAHRGGRVGWWKFTGLAGTRKERWWG